MTKSIHDMNKGELRAACKASGVKYGTMNNEGMRAALMAKQLEQGIGPVGGDGRPTSVEAPKPVAAKPAPAAPVVETPVVDASPREKVTGTVVKPKSLKIEKVRDANNGVTRPSAGSICRAIWDQLDSKRAADKAVPSFENLRDMMKQFNWSRNTAMTQYQRWKQFNGVMPRTTEVVDEAAEAGDDTGTEE